MYQACLSIADVLRVTSAHVVISILHNINSNSVCKWCATVALCVPEFTGGNVTFTFSVKHAECLLDLLLGVVVFHLLRHHVEELWEVNGAAPWWQ